MYGTRETTMANALSVKESKTHTILCVGPTGSGKTSQISTLPGRVFAYLFDPNALASIAGQDIEYEQFLPDVLELDSTLKGFNKGAKSDAPASKREPRVYMDWVEDFNSRYESGFFDDYDWIVFDSLTFLTRACMDRQLWINNRYGKIEELGDYRIVGSKISDIFRTIASMQTNIYCTGHITSFQDELTKKVETQLMLAGSAKTMLPLVFSNIWLAQGESTEKEAKYTIRTQPDNRGLQHIRTSIKGLPVVQDVTIKDFNNPSKYGIGAILAKEK